MLRTAQTMLAIASLLAVSATAMAAPAHRTHRMNVNAAAIYNARAQAPIRYDPFLDAFTPRYDGPGQTLFERAIGNIEGN